MTDKTARIVGLACVALALTWTASALEEPSGNCNPDGYTSASGRINIGTTLYYWAGGRDYVASGTVVDVQRAFTFEDGSSGRAVMVRLSDGLVVPRKREIVDDWFVRCP